MGEDDDMSQNVTILNSNSNVYASEAGYLFSPVRFRYRAFNQKYNDVYINGAPMNDMESGQFRFSNIGGLNRFSRNVDFALPFEGNNYSMTGMGGSNNYDFRAGSMQTGHYASVGVANRNYTLRGLYTYSSGFNDKGWAISAGLTYRWANRGYVEGTFYNALSYYFGVQKKWDNGHSYRALYTGSSNRRDLLARQRLLLQPILGLLQWPQAQLTRCERLCAISHRHMGLGHQRQDEAHHLCLWQVLYVQEHQAQLCQC